MISYCVFVSQALHIPSVFLCQLRGDLQLNISASLGRRETSTWRQTSQLVFVMSEKMEFTSFAAANGCIRWTVNRRWSEAAVLLACRE